MTDLQRYEAAMRENHDLREKLNNALESVESYKQDLVKTWNHVHELEDKIQQQEVALKNAMEKQWISVEVIKPQWGVPVRIRHINGAEDTRRFSYDYKWVSKGMKTGGAETVTHWRPLTIEEIEEFKKAE